MNPPPSLPYESFTSRPSYLYPHFHFNPNPNFNPNFFYGLPQNSPSNPSTTATTTTGISSSEDHHDLSTTLSTLKDLINFSQNTVESLSNLLHLTSVSKTAKPSDLVPCPFNRHHRLLPELLFRHFLRCPSSPHANSPDLDLGFVIDSLCYPKTLESSAELLNQKRFIQELHDTNAEFCFSLDDYCNFGSNFFYQDCPGVVSMSEPDGAKRTFTLPGILSVECANFGGDRDIKGFSSDSIGLLPSELWAVKREVEAWNDYPSVYSYGVLKALLGSYTVKECDFKRWAIVESPRYNIVIDVHMRDHIFVLFKLCLKAIMREALGLADIVVNKREQELEVSLENRRYNCPVLVQVLMWLASQLSVLYGEANGKFFAIGLFRHWISESASGLLLFTSEEKVTESSIFKGVLQDLDAECTDNKDSELEKPLERSRGCKSDGLVKATIVNGVIFVSQVAAAVAALQERSLLEGKIRGLQFSQSTSRHQRLAEHAYISKRADEERKKRPNYRPIIEHDGRPREQLYNQEIDKHKTKEELLAEERDYKRRRMSYRGKKLKRTTLEVTRDIIEEYMEDIKQAGGIGCFVKEAEDRGILPSKLPGHGITTNIEKTGKNYFELSGATGGSQNHYRKPSQFEENIKSRVAEDFSPKHYQPLRSDIHGHHEQLGYEKRSHSKDRRNRLYHSRSPERSKSHGRSHERGSQQRELDDMVSRTWHHGMKQPYSSTSNHSGTRPPSSLSNLKDVNVIKDNQKVEARQRRSKYSDYRPSSRVQNAFDDRYDPSESNEIYEFDASAGSIYNRSDKVYSKEVDE